jgi:hypothetical protein
MKKLIAIIFLSSWIPFLCSVYSPSENVDWTLITGVMWIVFGNLEAILLLRGK